MKTIAICLALLISTTLWAQTKTTKTTTVPGAAQAKPATGPSGVTGATGATGPTGASGPQNPPKYDPAGPGVYFSIFGLMIAILSFGLIYAGLTLKGDKNWNLSDAMSGADGKPSSSRLIAFIGMVVMITVILGIGYSSLWVFLMTGVLPKLSDVTPFLVGCAGLFTPYLASQISTAFGAAQPTALAPVVVQTAAANAPVQPAQPIPNPPGQTGQVG
jgi:hypothetical protein